MNNIHGTPNLGGGGSDRRELRDIMEDEFVAGIAIGLASGLLIALIIGFIVLVLA